MNGIETSSLVMGGLMVIIILLLCMPAVWVVRRFKQYFDYTRKDPVTSDFLNDYRSTDAETSTVNTLAKSDARWVKTLKTQMHQQNTVDIQFRDGRLTIHSREKTAEYWIDWWILRRLRQHRPVQVFALLEHASDFGVITFYDIKRFKNKRTQKQFRERKRHFN